MYPILIALGPITIYSFTVFLALAWFTFSFFFWRGLRASGTEEDRIFDLTFYATIAAGITARLGFVFTHWELFSDTWLKILAVWVQPGLSLYGGLLGGIATLASMSRTTKVRLGLVLDALASALPPALFIGSIGAFLDGSVAGKIIQAPWAFRIAGDVGGRHPVALYEIAVLILFMAFIHSMRKRAQHQHKPFGVVGVWFFLLYSLNMFILEFFKDSRVYWSFTGNQWVLIAIFAESLGALYVRGGGREWLRPVIRKLYAKISNGHSQ